MLPLVLSERLHRGAVAAAEGVVAAIDAAARRAHEDPGEAARYGYHPDVTRLVRASWGAGDRTSWVRVDLLLGEDGVWRACEVNADCPGGHNEAFGLPRLARAAGFAEGVNPTTDARGPGGAPRRAGAGARRGAGRGGDDLRHGVVGGPPDLRAPQAHPGARWA